MFLNYLWIFLLPGLIYADAGADAGAGGGAEKKTNASEGQFVVSLKTKSLHICAGTIIGERLVITAAHCVVDTNKENVDTYYIVAGSRYSNRITNVSEAYSAERILVHPKFKVDDFKTYGNDLALVFVDDLIVVNNKTIGIAPLVKKKPKNFAGCIAMGWGSETDAENLLSISMDVKPPKNCDTKEKLPEGSLCGIVKEKGDGKASLPGNAGSPLFCNKELVGVSSHLLPDSKFVYTSIWENRDWIIQNSAMYLSSPFCFVKFIFIYLLFK